MSGSLVAGAAYFGFVFAAGFVLGVIRTLAVAPLVGDVLAVILELPVILTIAWYACGSLIRRFEVEPRRMQRMVMGLTAFVLLMIGEMTISLGLAERTLAEHLRLYQQSEHLLGLAGQVAFAAFPWLRLRRAERRRVQSR
jgi:ABC-type uncharacterized transport system permease subunit